MSVAVPVGWVPLTEVNQTSKSKKKSTFYDVPTLQVNPPPPDTLTSYPIPDFTHKDPKEGLQEIIESEACLLPYYNNYVKYDMCIFWILSLIVIIILIIFYFFNLAHVYPQVGDMILPSLDRAFKKVPNFDQTVSVGSAISLFVFVLGVLVVYVIFLIIKCCVLCKKTCCRPCLCCCMNRIAFFIPFLTPLICLITISIAFFLTFGNRTFFIGSSLSTESICYHFIMRMNEDDLKTNLIGTGIQYFDGISTDPGWKQTLIDHICPNYYGYCGLWEFFRLFLIVPYSVLCVLWIIGIILMIYHYFTISTKRRVTAGTDDGQENENDFYSFEPPPDEENPSPYLFLSPEA